MAGQHALAAGPLDEVLELAVRKLWSSPSKPCSGTSRRPIRRPAPRVLAALEADPADGRLARCAARLTCGSSRRRSALDRTPVERAVGDQVHERGEHRDREDDHLDQSPNAPSSSVDDRPRVEEDDLDVEDDEDHRDQVEAHREALGRLLAGHDAALVGRRLRRRRAAGRQQVRRHEAERREQRRRGPAGRGPAGTGPCPSRSWRRPLAASATSLSRRWRLLQHTANTIPEKSVTTTDGSRLAPRSRTMITEMTGLVSVGLGQRAGPGRARSPGGRPAGAARPRSGWGGRSGHVRIRLALNQIRSSRLASSGEALLAAVAERVDDDVVGLRR